MMCLNKNKRVNLFKINQLSQIRLDQVISQGRKRLLSRQCYLSVSTVSSFFIHLMVGVGSPEATHGNTAL